MNIFPDRVVDDKGEAKIKGGLTLRDYFAAQAMQGILSGALSGQNPNVWELARDAYRVADAMIETREP